MVRANQLESPDEWVHPGVRVLVKDKNLHGTIRFVGETEFAPGTWIGVELDEPKGKNNGTVKGKVIPIEVYSNICLLYKVYFECRDKHGLMVRVAQLEPLGDTGKRHTSSKIPSPGTKRSLVPRSSTSGGVEKTITPVSSPKPRHKSPVFPKEESEPQKQETLKPTSFAVSLSY